MKRLIFALFILTLIVGCIFFLKSLPKDTIWDDADYYTELKLESGSSEFERAKRFLMIDEEKIYGKEIAFYLYKKDSQIELHAIIKDEFENCSSIHARELTSGSSVFQQISFNDDADSQSVTHSCSGQDCSACRFTRGIISGKINGCRCRTGFGKCNHTISTVEEEELQ